MTFHRRFSGDDYVDGRPSSIQRPTSVVCEFRKRRLTFRQQQFELMQRRQQSPRAGRFIHEVRAIQILKPRRPFRELGSQSIGKQLELKIVPIDRSTIQDPLGT